MEITYPERVRDTAELSIDGQPVQYPIPPKIGTHKECFALDTGEEGVRLPTGREIAAYAQGALVHRKNEWADQERIRFPTHNPLRFQNVFTIIPAIRTYGDLAGGMLVDFDEKGEGIDMNIQVPKDLSGFVQNSDGLLEKDKRIFLPNEDWYKETWDEKYAVLISLAGREGASVLEQASVDSGRTYRPVWRDNPEKISSPIKQVPVLYGCGGGGLSLGCSSHGNYRYGCVPRVRETSTEGAKSAPKN